MDDFLVFDHVSKHFGDTHALKSVHLSLRQGEFFSLLGPSGCGKTTLLRLAAGFEYPTSGNILLKKSDITRLPPEQRPVNTVFQNYALFPHLSVFENIAFGLRLNGQSGPVIKKKVSSMLELVQLSQHAHKRPSQLSGGQRQRVAIARALINRPQVLLLDEPLAALDLKLRQHMLGELSRLHREIGITFLFVTHDQEEAMSLSDRIAVMNHGVLEQVGTPQELYNHPRNRFVAAFVGDANFLEGIVKGTEPDGRCRVVIPDLGEISVETDHSPQCGSEVTLFLRPEHLHLIPSRDSAPTHLKLFEAVIDNVIYRGASTGYMLQTGARKLHMEVTNHQGRDDPSLHHGDQILVGFDPRHVMFLNPDSSEVGN